MKRSKDLASCKLKNREIYWEWKLGNLREFSNNVHRLSGLKKNKRETTKSSIIFSKDSVREFPKCIWLLKFPIIRWRSEFALSASYSNCFSTSNKVRRWTKSCERFETYWMRFSLEWSVNDQCFRDIWCPATSSRTVFWQTVLNASENSWKLFEKFEEIRNCLLLGRFWRLPESDNQAHPNWMQIDLI